MNRSMCYSCDHSIAIKYVAKQDKEFSRLKCTKLMEYVEKYDMKLCSNHSTISSIDQIKQRLASEES